MRYTAQQIAVLAATADASDWQSTGQIAFKVGRTSENVLRHLHMLEAAGLLVRLPPLLQLGCRGRSPARWAATEAGWDVIEAVLAEREAAGSDLDVRASA